MATPESSRDLAYVTAPCTPIRCHSLERMYLYSVPTSPSKLPPGASEPTTPNPYGYAQEFHFETSYRFDSDFEESRNFEYSGGPMSFADELFCDGKVMPQLKLKLPPRLQHGSAKEFTDVPSSHRGRKIRWNSWKEDDFDPFTVAMDRISKDKKSKTRRARSISPSPVNRPNGSLVYPSNSRSGPIILVNQSEADGDGYSKSVMLAEPKGLSFARSLRLVKMGHEGPMKGSSKRHKIKEFLFRTPTPAMKSQDKNTMVDQLEPKTATRFSFKSGRSIQVYGNKEKKKASQVTNGALVQYRPRLFLCLGYGMKKSTF